MRGHIGVSNPSYREPQKLYTRVRVCKVFGSALLEIRVDVLKKNRYPLVKTVKY